MFIDRMKQSALLNAKNLVGWKTKRNIVVFSVDDYGNVRLASQEARKELDKAGFPAKNRFDRLDTLETRQDLEMLYETLFSVRDKNGRHPVITAYAVPCNINFEKLAQKGFSVYQYELLPQTFEKMSVLDSSNYKGAWNLWNEGIHNGLMAPQFHGREHLNLNVFEERLYSKDQELLCNLENRSFTGLCYRGGYNTVSPMSAFDFWDFEENERFHDVIKDGLKQFENVFGYRARNFTPPVYIVHPVLYDTLSEEGIRFIDTSMVTKEHQGRGKYKRKFQYTGKKTQSDLRLMVRNVVFEPSADRGVDWPSYAMRQIEAAFRWNSPAIISSHRVNFCGYIEEQNRREGLSDLKKLLKEITQRWPDIEFMSASELGDLIETGQNDPTKIQT